MRVGFLFKHYAAHQVLHAAPIAFALSRRYPQVEVKVITVNRETEPVVRHLATLYPRAALRIRADRGAEVGGLDREDALKSRADEIFRSPGSPVGAICRAMLLWSSSSTTTAHIAEGWRRL